VNQPDILQDKKERNDFYIALFVLALFGLFLWYFIFGGNTTASMEILDDQATELTAELPESEHIYESEEVIEEVESDVVKTEKVSAPKTDLDQVVADTREEMEQASDKVNEIVSDVTEGVEDVADNAAEMVDEAKESMGDAVGEVVDEAEAVVEDVKASAKEGLETIEEKTKEVVAPITRSTRSSNNGDVCHISVGLYKDGRNVDKILNRLKRQGFDAYTKRIARSTQVGVYVTCERDEALSVLSEIRSDFARDAYIEEFR